MVDAVQEALGKDGGCGGSGNTSEEEEGEKRTEWWTQLCANKHLTEDSKLKSVS